MNKDVIYIEPENDITDIIEKVKTAKPKVVAIVPPKKSTVLASAVNFKLLARASKTASKSIVIVTADPALLKLASIAEIPVAKNLQTRPEIPLVIKDNSSPEKTVAADEADELIEVTEKSTPKKPSEDEVIEELDAEADAEADTDEKKDDKDKKSAKKSKKSLVPNLDRWRKWIILGSIALVLFIGFLVWALVFAPAVKITVTIRPSGHNFSAPITLTTDPKKEDIDGAVFALETVELTKKASAEFTATGEVNRGDKAAGTVAILVEVSTIAPDPVKIASGTTFTNNGLIYTATKDTSIALPDDPAECAPGSTAYWCRVSAKINVAAEHPGAKYNTTAASGWTSSNIVAIQSIGESAISGGTDKVVRIVTQQDFNNARALLTSSSEAAGRSDLLDKFPDSTFPIADSFKSHPKEPTSSPKVGEEVKDGVTPTITAETVFTMFGVDKNALSSFIENNPKFLSPSMLPDYKIYATGIEDDKIRIDGFKPDGDTAKLVSSSVQTGPAITETEILDKSSGKKIGEVKTLLKPILGSNGTIDIKPSVFWVSTVPTDPNRVEIIITLEQ